MKLRTKYLGEVEVDETKTLQFSNGLPGFSDETNFVILDIPDNQVFQLLQSTKTSSLAFVITNPYLFYKNYEFTLPNELQETLKIKNQADVAVYVIVTLNEPFSESTLNLRAPVIINTKNFIGKQYILNDSPYSSRTSITPSKKEDE